MSQSSKIKAFIVLLLFVCIGFWLLAMYWGQEPEQFSVKTVAKEETAKVNATVVVGSTVTATSIYMIETLLNKPGGFLSNDVAPPSVFFDNIPSWETGVLFQLRDVVRAMRDSFSRSQSQSTEDKALAKAESRLNISKNSWMFPNAQDEYQSSANSLRAYLQRLDGNQKQPAEFYARADNLTYWLGLIEVRLGDLSQKLSESVGQHQLQKTIVDSNGSKSELGKTARIEQTGWLEVDDIFYEARGSTWALLHLLKAVEVDFSDILKSKNADVSLAQIIRELESTQNTVYSPIILNGGGFGLWANHSLVMASYVSRANAAIIDLRELLQNG